MAPRPSDPPPPPTFDARLFEPPTWATDGFHASRARQTGEASSSREPVQADAHDHDHDHAHAHDHDHDNAEEAPEELPTAFDLGVEVDDSDTLQFTTTELKNLLARAAALKDEGNKRFVARPQQLDDARDSYLAALDNLPSMALVPKYKPRAPKVSGIQEVTDEEAEAIESERLHPEDQERRSVEDDIRDCMKAVWGNLGAVYLAKKEYKAVVDACTKALEIDLHYTKALHRRASANEEIGSWSSLTSAQEDYTMLLSLISKSSPQLPAIRRTLSTLPRRISAQQEKEKDEMMDKLKELGNGILGKFGLSTDMFKFDEQAGGGYNLRFQK